MNLVEEYYKRHELKCPLIQYADRSQILLRGKAGAEYSWMNVNLEIRNEPNHPPHYYLLVSGSPVIYATPDFHHFNFHHERNIYEKKIEWDQYEPAIMDWANSIKQKYQAVTSNDAMPECWRMFVRNYDSWFANYLPFRLFDFMHMTLGDGENNYAAIGEIEIWLRDKYDRAYQAWYGIRRYLDNRNYADWLAKIVNRT